MLVSNEFDEIRPYYDEEVPEYMNKLLADPVFARVLKNFFVDDAKIQEIREAMLQTRNVESFQLRFMMPFLENILNSSTRGLTVGGLENLKKDESYLYISNHRDIVLDSALLNVQMYKYGYNSTEIAMGSNLLVYQWIEDLSRVNRSFIVKRNVPVRETLEASKLLSAYIRQTITHNGNSIWIAQREGRSKDGLDQTSPALLKMLNMSNNQEFVQGFQELRIVPMTIAYEIEPCGNEKVAELLKRQSDPGFRKSEKDDLLSMISGLKNQKGRIQIQFGTPISRSELKELSAEGHINDRLKRLADYIDRQIYTNYRLFPNNYIAYDLYYNCNKYIDKYTTEEQKLFIELTHQRLKLVNEDRAEAMDLWLKMYSTPVYSFENCCQHDPA
ncbi:MAG: 1-acyl-sn-glycerol-3-phosphate acyltransferase [Bacteroidia bacterium]|nr:1-acyl-sn-glycerol-3-phosphate acyltransferase [Bacteroidia bacterium]